MPISPHSITSVFFGGGTPSLAPPSTIAAILESVSRWAKLSGDAEVTLEVNPTPVGLSQLQDYCRAGVNRFSIGVQVNFLHTRHAHIVSGEAASDTFPSCRRSRMRI